MNPLVLVVGNAPGGACETVDELTHVGHRVRTLTRLREVCEDLAQILPDVLVADCPTDPDFAHKWLADVLEVDALLPVVLVAEPRDRMLAIDLVAAGAQAYLTTPFRPRELHVVVERAHARRRLRQEHRELERHRTAHERAHRMVGSSAALAEVITLLHRVAPSAVPVLILGESGSGKELIARTIHDVSGRKGRFVAVNCSAIPDQLLESELFGHTKGAFTDAGEARRGLFAEAHHGTLFLDEIGDMPAALQAKLLRVLQDGEVRPLGADAARSVNVRTVAATHQPLEKRVEDGSFRADLFYRLNVLQVRVPALRERIEDIPSLLEHFLERARGQNPFTVVEGFSPGAIARLAQHPWPGNVRELENVVLRLAITTVAATVYEAAVERVLDVERSRTRALPEPRADLSHELITLREMQERHIAWTLEVCGNNKAKAARCLGVDVSTLHRRARSARERRRRED